MQTVKARVTKLCDDYSPVIPIVIPDLKDVRAFANRIHQKGALWQGDVFGWSAEYHSECSQPPIDSNMTFTPADFCIGESGIWFFSMMWEDGKNQPPVEFLDDRGLVGRVNIVI